VGGEDSCPGALFTAGGERKTDSPKYVLTNDHESEFDKVY